jgi:hypothetical protein
LVLDTGVLPFNCFLFGGDSQLSRDVDVSVEETLSSFDIEYLTHPFLERNRCMELFV